jgi:hypothetical protein
MTMIIMMIGRRVVDADCFAVCTRYGRSDERESYAQNYLDAPGHAERIGA